MQVLAKSCKMVPVMIMGTLVGGKRYSTIEYLCVGLIAGGVSLFASQVSPQNPRQTNHAVAQQLKMNSCSLHLGLGHMQRSSCVSQASALRSLG